MADKMVSARELAKDGAHGLKFGFEDYIDPDDFEPGYCGYGEMSFDGLFDAFKQRQYGVVGGDKTVDDFTPDGLEKE